MMIRFRNLPQTGIPDFDFTNIIRSALKNTISGSFVAKFVNLAAKIRLLDADSGRLPRRKERYSAVVLELRENVPIFVRLEGKAAHGAE